MTQKSEFFFVAGAKKLTFEAKKIALDWSQGC